VSARFAWADRLAYGLWLAQTHSFVRHTPALLGLAASRAGHSRRELAQLFQQHLAEEHDHDLIALRDIERLGFAVGELPELAVTAAFYQSQYFWIEHVSPASLFGYALFLEGLAAFEGPALLPVLQVAHGRESAGFVGFHARVDREHVAHGLDEIGGLLEPGEAEIVLRNACQSKDLYAAMLRDVIELASSDRLARHGNANGSTPDRSGG
jgi:hypothetical protein